MSSRLAVRGAATAKREGLFGGKARQFYLEVCRCVPFIHSAMRLQELATPREIRSVIKERFKEYKGVTDPRVIDMLIFKGREELEVYLSLHKQRHHAISEYLEPIMQRKTAFPTQPSSNSAFLDTFLSGNYAAPTGK